MGRYKGENKSIDSKATKRFFEERGEKIGHIGSLGAVLYQDQNPALAIQRHEVELQRVKHLLKPESAGHVLDIGCGTGRWALALADTLTFYLGLDFCAEFLAVAEKSVETMPNPEYFQWQQWDFSAGNLPAGNNNKFDLIIVAGIFLYLNDQAVIKLMHAIAKLSSLTAKIYIREPLALHERLTLDCEYSNDLKTNYSAIYRSMQEFEDMLWAKLGAYGFNLIKAEDLYLNDMNNRPDTRQRFYILTRDIR